MAQVDVKWPSEDEEFDATTHSADTATATQPEPNTNVEDNGISPEEPAENLPAESSNQPEAEAPAPVAPQPPASTSTAKGFLGAPLWRWAVEAVLVAAVVGLGLWAWTLRSDRADLQSQLNSAQANPQALVQKQTNDLIAKVGQLMNLPTGETPTVANVTNAAQAKAQSAFFANAQNGDKVLMYVKAGEAILYRPSTNKIILVAPLTFSNAASGTTSTKTSTSH